MIDCELKIHGSSFFHFIFRSTLLSMRLSHRVASELLTQLCGALGMLCHTWPHLIKNIWFKYFHFLVIYENESQ